LNSYLLLFFMNTIDVVDPHGSSESCIRMLRSLNITFIEVTHEPVLDYVKATEIRARFDLTGRETKSLFLKGKGGDYFVFLTSAETRVDFKALKTLLGMKIGIASHEELLRETGFTPGCVGPFGLKSSITLVIDMSIFDFPRLIFSPGNPTTTIEMTSESLRLALEGVENRKLLFPCSIG